MASNQLATNGNGADYREGLVAPQKDERYKTEDVTDTKGRDFEDFFLKRELLMGIFEKGFEKPSPIQEEAIPVILQNRNVLARAKNGTGKTAAYIIPCLEKTDTTQNHIQGKLLAVKVAVTCLRFKALVPFTNFFFDLVIQQF
jgi:ATP-dependent RNA helicase DDX6/DHH1